MIRFKSLFVLALFAIGCAQQKYELPNTVKLTGSLSNGGEILTVEGRENATGMIMVGFHPITDGRTDPETTSASVDEEGKFEVYDGIKPGEYLITVRQWEPYPSNDLLKGKFGPKKSKIRRTVEGDTELVIDLTNPEG